jgi:hypothetical protein
MRTKEEHKLPVINLSACPVQRKKEMDCMKDDCRGQRLSIQTKSIGNAKGSGILPIVHEVLSSRG